MEKQKTKIIIGITGPIAGGKGTVAEILTKKGFSVSALSDRIREEINKTGGEITRERLLETGNKLRKQFGSQVLAQRTYEKFAGKGIEKIVIESIRAVPEVEYLKNKGAVIIGVTAPRELRFRRAAARNREGEALTWEEFVEIDSKDFLSGKSDKGTDIQGCLELADYLIENTGTREELEREVEKILNLIAEKKQNEKR